MVNAQSLALHVMQISSDCFVNFYFVCDAGLGSKTHYTLPVLISATPINRTDYICGCLVPSRLSYGVFTLHGTGAGTGTGNRIGTTGNNGSRFLSLSQTSVYISVQFNVTHWIPVPVPFPVPCNVSVPLARDVLRHQLGSNRYPHSFLPCNHNLNVKQLHTQTSQLHCVQYQCETPLPIKEKNGNKQSILHVTVSCTRICFKTYVYGLKLTSKHITANPILSRIETKIVL